MGFLRPTRSRERGPCAGFLLLIWAAALLLVPAAGKGVYAQAQADEYSVKAAFLFHFVQLVQWPEDAFDSPTKPLDLCTLNADPFHGRLEAAMAGKVIGSRTIQVRHLKRFEDVRSCNVLFVPDQELRYFTEILSQVSATSILTVGDSDQFVEQGGMIGFCRESNKIRFNVNQKAAEGARLKISSRLLMLAKNVSGSEGRK